jgi:hypothetical protein
MSETPAWFAARLLFERSFDSGTPATALYEESVVLLKSATGMAGAEKKATKLGKDASHSYKNVDGETVTWTFREVLDIYQLNDSEIREGSEVYSRFLSAADMQSVRASLSASRL